MLHRQELNLNKPCIPTHRWRCLPRRERLTQRAAQAFSLPAGFAGGVGVGAFELGFVGCVGFFGMGRSVAQDMKVTYDKEADAAYIQFSVETPDDADEVSDGIVFDLAPNDRLIGIEILDASKRFSVETLTKFEIDQESINDAFEMSKSKSD